jgi:hypothetical protein
MKKDGKTKKDPVLRLLLLSLPLVILLGGATIVRDVVVNQSIRGIDDRVIRETFIGGPRIEQVLWDILNDTEYNSEHILHTAQHLNSRVDTSDFRTPSILHVLYKYPDRLRAEDREILKRALLDYRYWIKDPGEDSMVFWSENHQILGAVAEHLAGQLYPDEIFTNTGKTGAWHRDRGAERIAIWLEQRWTYGFVEWYSNTYYKEDIAPLAALISFTENEELRRRASIIMDLLFYDIATQSYNGSFISSSGRAYEHDRKSDAGSDFEVFLEILFDFDADEAQPEMGPHMLLAYLDGDNYELPPIFESIIKDPETRIIRASNGLNVSELAGEGLVGHEDPQIMMQWAMESFTNPEIIHNSVTFIHEYGLLRNSDLNAFKDVNIGLLRSMKLLPFVSRVLNPQQNGVSIQRANAYTYRTPEYMMYSAQEYHPGDYGDQQHVFGITLDADLMIFHTHPAVPPGAGGVNGNSPKYWVGYGHIPHTAQDQNVNLSIYRLPRRKGIMEKALLEYTHAWFPFKKFDEAIVDGNIAAGRRGDAYVAIIASGELRYRSERLENLILAGKESWWITEAGSAGSDGTFDGFLARIRAQADDISYDRGTLSYPVRGGDGGPRLLELAYQSGFSVDGQPVDTSYPRFDSVYLQAERKPDELAIAHGGMELLLDFRRQTRRW